MCYNSKSITTSEGILAKVQDCIEVSKFELELQFTREKAGIAKSLQLWVKPYHSCSSIRIALALNNQRSLKWHKRKKERLIASKVFLK